MKTVAAMSSQSIFVQVVEFVRFLMLERCLLMLAFDTEQSSLEFTACRFMPASHLHEVIGQAKCTLALYEQVCKPSAAAMRFLLEQLEVAQTIVLEVPLVPENGSTSRAATLQHYALGLIHHLPQPVVIEYEHSGVYDVQSNLTQALSTRRMAVVIPMQTEFAVSTQGLKDFELQTNDDGALMVWSINYFDEKKEWEFAPSVAIIGRHQGFEFLDNQRGLFDRLTIGWRVNKKEQGEILGDPIMVRYQNMLTELIRQLPSGEISRIAREVSMDACWAALGVLTALSCDNVDYKVSGGVQSLKEKSPLSAYINNQWVPLNPFQGVLECTRLGQWSWNQSHVSKFEV